MKLSRMEIYKTVLKTREKFRYLHIMNLKMKINVVCKLHSAVHNCNFNETSYYTNEIRSVITWDDAYLTKVTIGTDAGRRRSSSVNTPSLSSPTQCRDLSMNSAPASRNKIKFLINNSPKIPDKGW